MRNISTFLGIKNVMKEWFARLHAVLCFNFSEYWYIGLYKEIPTFVICFFLKYEYGGFNFSVSSNVGMGI